LFAHAQGLSHAPSLAQQRTQHLPAQWVVGMVGNEQVGSGFAGLVVFAVVVLV
jgi:hypothetical protein